MLRAIGRLHLLLLVWVVALLPLSHQLAEVERVAAQTSGSVALGMTGNGSTALLQGADEGEGLDPHGPACVICRVLDSPRFGSAGVEVFLGARTAAIPSGTHEMYAPQGARPGGNARAPPLPA